MMVSTKGRYALIVMIDMAFHRDTGRISLADISKRQGISLKYLESITAMLVKAGYLRGSRGRGGGYILAKDPSECSVGDIIKLTEGSLAPVACLEGDEAQCPKVSECLTYPMWANLDNLIDSYLGSISIQDLIDLKVTVTNK